MKLNYSIIPFLIISVILVCGCTNLTSFNKPKFYCETSDTSCSPVAELMILNCENYILTEDSPSLTMSYDITKIGDTCHIVVIVDNSVMSGFKGLSMTCDVPMQKIEVFKKSNSFSLEGFKYCEGPLKDAYFKTMNSMFGTG